MKIGNNYHKYLNSVQQTQRKKKLNNEIENTQTKTNKNVKIDISDQAKKLSKASQNHSGNERIEELKAAIANDAYEVNPEKIADGILWRLEEQRD